MACPTPPDFHVHPPPADGSDRDVDQTARAGSATTASTKGHRGRPFPAVTVATTDGARERSFWVRKTSPPERLRGGCCPPDGVTRYRPSGLRVGVTGGLLVVRARAFSTEAFEDLRDRRVNWASNCWSVCSSDSPSAGTREARDHARIPGEQIACFLAAINHLTGQVPEAPRVGGEDRRRPGCVGIESLTDARHSGRAETVALATRPATSRLRSALRGLAMLTRVR